MCSRCWGGTRRQSRSKVKPRAANAALHAAGTSRAAAAAARADCHPGVAAAAATTAKPARSALPCLLLTTQRDEKGKLRRGDKGAPETAADCSATPRLGPLACGCCCLQQQAPSPGCCCCCYCAHISHTPPAAPLLVCINPHTCRISRGREAQSAGVAFATFGCVPHR